jgi:MarR family transcriptional regulator, transcriptional regulator for hemolysin
VILLNSHELFHTLHQLSRHLTNKLNETLKPFGLYSAQWSVLYTLMKKGSLTQRELSDYLFVEAPPMTRTIQRLVKQGYVKQVPGKDKREKYIELTEAASQEFPKWEQAVIANNETQLMGLPEESQKQLINIQSSWLKHLL